MSHLDAFIHKAKHLQRARRCLRLDVWTILWRKGSQPGKWDCTMVWLRAMPRPPLPEARDERVRVRVRVTTEAVVPRARSSA